MLHGRIRTLVATLPLLILTVAVRPESAAQVEDVGIYRAHAEGSGFEQLPVRGRNPAPSPDGALLAFATGGPEGPAISVMAWDGTGERRVTLTTGISLAPSWSPDGRQLAFLQADQAYTLTLSVVNLDGSGLTELAKLGTTYPSPPAWSPDGTRLAYAGPGTGGSDLWTVNADGTDATQLADLPGQVEGPAFAPDGTRIAFSEQQYEGERQSWVRVVRPDGSELVDVATWTAGRDPGPDNIGAPSSNGPSWSPDGATLAFAAIQGVSLVAADGSGAEMIALGEDGQAVDVVYAPAGDRLAFGYSIEFGQLPSGPTLDPAEYEDIYVMRTDGTELTLVGATAQVDRRPLWSPDGTSIVFENEPAGN